MEAADELDMTLIASASLLQGQVAKNLPGFVAEALGLDNDAERALQFVRSAPGITHRAPPRRIRQQNCCTSLSSSWLYNAGQPWNPSLNVCHLKTPGSPTVRLQPKPHRPAN